MLSGKSVGNIIVTIVGIGNHPLVMMEGLGEYW